MVGTWQLHTVLRKGREWQALAKHLANPTLTMIMRMVMGNEDDNEDDNEDYNEDYNEE